MIIFIVIWYERFNYINSLLRELNYDLIREIIYCTPYPKSLSLSEGKKGSN